MFHVKHFKKFFIITKFYEKNNENMYNFEVKKDNKS